MWWEIAFDLRIRTQTTFSPKIKEILTIYEKFVLNIVIGLSQDNYLEDKKHSKLHRFMSILLKFMENQEDSHIEKFVQTMDTK